MLSFPNTTIRKHAPFSPPNLSPATHSFRSTFPGCSPHAVPLPHLQPIICCSLLSQSMPRCSSAPVPQFGSVTSPHSIPPIYPTTTAISRLQSTPQSPVQWFPHFPLHNPSERLTRATGHLRRPRHLSCFASSLPSNHDLALQIGGRKTELERGCSRVIRGVVRGEVGVQKRIGCEGRWQDPTGDVRAWGSD